MNKLPKDKRDRLMMTIVMTGFVTLAFYTFVIRAQRERIRAAEDKLEQATLLLDRSERWLRMKEKVRADLAEERTELQSLEARMAPLDKFKWFYNTLESFRSSYDVRLIDISREPEIGEVGVLPGFPYKSAKFGVKLNGTYHDFGKFLADFENQFPYMRVQDLKIELPPNALPPGTGGTSMAENPSANNERLAISLNVVALIKPSTIL